MGTSLPACRAKIDLVSVLGHLFLDGSADSTLLSHFVSHVDVACLPCRCKPEESYQEITCSSDKVTCLVLMLVDTKRGAF